MIKRKKSPSACAMVKTVAIFMYQEKAPSRDSTYRHVLPASTSKGKLTSTMTTVIARVLLQPRMSATYRQRVFLSRALLLNVPIRKLHAHAVALHNQQRPHAHFLVRTSTVLFVLVTSGGIVIRGLLSNQQTD